MGRYFICLEKNMNLLQFFFIISGFLLLVLSYDIAKRQKFNALHFIVFIWVWAWLLAFTLFPQILNLIGSIFWLQRGADVLVYASIIFLLYFAILLLNKVETSKEDISSLVREIAILNSKKEVITWEICFLVRVYNEEKVVKKTLEELLQKGYKNILVVNDGSSDNSRQILEAFWDKIILLQHYKNRWWGAALETGFEYIRRYGKTDFVCTFDADGQHDIEDIDVFLEVLKNQHDIDIVLGSRFIKKTNTNVWIIRKMVLKAGILFTYFISHLMLTDSHNGYRVFRTKILKEIKLKMDDMSYASEMIDIISEKKIKFTEVPVNILYTDYSLSKWQKSSNAIHIALKTLWYKFFR